MTPRDFCYWLNGLFELAEPTSLSEKQTAMIKRHLKLVMTNVTGEEDDINFPELLAEIAELASVKEDVQTAIEEEASDSQSEGSEDMREFAKRLRNSRVICSAERYQTFC